MRLALRIIIILAFFGLGSSQLASATVYYSKPSATAFNTFASWGINTDGSGTIPTVFDNTHDFIVSNGSVMSTSAVVSIRRLTVSSSCSLTVNNLITISGSSPQFNLNGTLIFNATISSGSSSWRSTLFGGTSTIGTSSVFIVQSIGSAPSTGIDLSSAIITGNAWGAFIWRAINYGSATLNFVLKGGTTFYGKFQIDQTGTASSTTIRMTGSISSQTFTFKDNFEINNGKFELTNSATNNTYIFEKDFFIGTTGNFGNGTSNSSTYSFTGLNAQWTQSGLYNTSNGTAITIGASAKLTLNSNLIIASSRTLTVNGALDAKTSVISGAGNFNLASTGTLISGNINGFRTSASSGTVQVSGTRTWNAAGKYELNGTVAQTTGFVTHNAGGDALMSQLLISNTTDLVTLDADLEVAGPFTVNANSIFRANDGDNIKRGLGGTVILNGTFRLTDADGFAGGNSSGCALTNYSSPQITVASTSTVEYIGTTQIVTSFTDYGNLSVTTANTKSADGNITAAGSLTVSAGTFDYSADQVNVAGALVGGGALVDNSSSTFTISGSSAAASWPFATTLNGAFTLNRANGANLEASLIVLGTTTLTNGTLGIGTSSLTLNGIISGTQAITGSTSATLIIGGTGTVSAFATPATLGILTVSPSASRTLILSQGLSISTAITIGANGIVAVDNHTLALDGTFSATSGATLTLGSTSGILSITGSGSALSFPTAIASIANGLVSITRANGLSLNGNLAVNNLEFVSGGLALAGNQLTINGDYTKVTSGLFFGSNTSKLQVLGSGSLTAPLVFDQTGTNSNLNQLIINRTSGIVTIGSDLGIAGTANLLSIITGTLNASTFTLGSGSSNLTMTGGTLQLGKLSTTLPEIDGTITLSLGSTIELNGAGAQTVRGARNYQNLTLSGGGTKSFSSSITNANKIFGTFSIAGVSTLVDVGSNALGGNYDDATTTNFTMTGGEFRSSNTTTIVPAMSGTYNITGGKVTLYGTTGTQSQSLRGGRTYFDVDLNAAAANYRTGTDQAGNVVQGSGGITIAGTFLVKSPAVFATGTDFISGAGTFTIEAGAGLVYGSADGITLASATGNIRTTTRNYSPNAFYGVRGSTSSIVTGNGLPASVQGFIAGKSTGSLTFTSACTVNNNFYLSGGAVAGTNLTIANASLITRTGGSLTSAPTFGGIVNLLYGNNASTITTGPEVPLSVSVLNDVTINSNVQVSGGSNLAINGSFTFTAGNFNTLSNSVTLRSAASIIGETAASYLKGTVLVSRVVGTGASNFGNVGYELQAGTDNLGTVNLVRYASLGTALTGNGNQSIRRFYDVSITGSQPSAGRLVTISWTSDEDNGKNFITGNAAVFRRDNNLSPWMRLRLGNPYMPVTITGTIRSLLTRTFHFSEYTVTSESSPLPIVLANFSGKATETGARLIWVTQQEINNRGFRLERSLDGDMYDSIAFVIGQGNTSIPQAYQWHDNNFKEQAFYRLIQIDLNGAQEVLPTIFIKAGVAKPKLILYPNPASLYIQLDVSTPSQLAMITVIDVIGRVIYQGKDTYLNVAHWPQGLYQVTVSLNDGVTLVDKFLVK